MTFLVVTRRYNTNKDFETDANCKRDYAYDPERCLQVNNLRAAQGFTIRHPHVKEPTVTAEEAQGRLGFVGARHPAAVQAVADDLFQDATEDELLAAEADREALLRANGCLEGAPLVKFRMTACHTLVCSCSCMCSFVQLGAVPTDAMLPGQTVGRCMS
jgi:hypothetical protein